MIQQSRISVRCSNVSYPISKRTPDSQLLDVGSLICRLTDKRGSKGINNFLSISTGDWLAHGSGDCIQKHD